MTRGALTFYMNLHETSCRFPSDS